jgi:3-oxoadipate enol-lactonase
MGTSGSDRPGAVARRRVRVEGGHLAYATQGAGAPVVFVHAAIADSRMWDRELSLVGRDHRAISYDLRGFGGSSPATGPFSYDEDLRKLLDYLDAPRSFLVGASMGGAFAIDFALAHPTRVSGLLLVAPGLSGGFEGPYEPDEAAAFAFDEKKSGEIAEAVRRGDLTSATELLRQLWCASLEGASLELFHRMVSENAKEVFESPTMLQATSAPPAAAHLPELEVATTVLVGDRDNPSSTPFASRIGRAIPGARLVTVPGADHLINLSRPRAFESALMAGLAQVR